MKNATYLQYFSLIFQEENHNILLLLRISLDSNPINPGIPYLLGFVILSDSHIRPKDKFRTETSDEWKIEQTLMISHVCYHNVSRANKKLALFFMCFPSVQPVLFTLVYYVKVVQ